MSGTGGSKRLESNARRTSVSPSIAVERKGGGTSSVSSSADCVVGVSHGEARVFTERVLDAHPHLFLYRC